jgi:predicted O-linked N-acetylglucosamine transferase (SPINDLY family)
MLLPSHLARHRAADLFLDTAPCGAHTTASDALWAGLPVLTQTGESFASRVAASLLTALQLPELITENAVSFEAAATSLAMNPDELDVLKMRLAVNRQNGPLFHTERFARHLEASFHEIHERYRHGLPPANVFVQRDRNPAAQGP